ncbi:MAG: ribonuclease HII [Fibromonadales bacterium]|nr:ribonuclease HII [Fibromonadales bacterium]
MNFHHASLLPRNLTLLEAEHKLRKLYENCVLIGIDEAGRGPLAGPVVAAAAVLKNVMSLPDNLNDSKKLSENLREQIFEKLPDYCQFYSIGEASAQEIDEIGILNADFLAMRRALEQITSQLIEQNLPYKILVDGNLYIREMEKAVQMPIIKGDGRVACIAAASIFAKVHRDNLMAKYSEQFPSYGFAKHKGYGTKAHLTAIKEFGLCEIHRKTFRNAFSKL